MAGAKRGKCTISIPLSEAEIAIIDRAASLSGRSRTDFVGDAALRAAEAALMEQGLIHMSPEGFADFVAILSRPPAVVPELMEVLRRAARWEDEGSCRHFGDSEV